MRRRSSLRTQLLTWQLAIIAVTVLVTTAMALWLHERTARAGDRDQLAATALAVAALPSVHDAMESDDPPRALQQIAELVRRSAGVAYVIVTDADGRRLSHPNPALIGTFDPFDPFLATDSVAAREGMSEEFVDTMNGRALRVRAPIHDDDGAVIGSVTVGMLTSDINAAMWQEASVVIPWLIVAGATGALAATWVSRLAWRRVHRQEPEQIARALHAREAMLHAIGEAVVEVDENGDVTLVNDEAQRLLGVTPGAVGQPAQEVLDPALADLLLVPADPSDQGSPASPEHTGADGPKVSSGVGRTRKLVLVGERVLLVHRAEASVEGDPAGGLLIAADRTEMTETLRDLAGARDLTGALRAQAHEFANRMHVIAGLLHLGEPEEAAKFVERVCGGGALAEAGRSDLADRDVAALLLAKAALAAEREIDLDIVAGSQAAPDGTSDATTVLANLIDNALDAAGPGGRVEVWFETGPARLAVRVSDDGPGISDLDGRVFEPGFSTKAPDGRGFGLALVARIAARRGGSVVVGPGLGGRGASFEVSASDAAARPAMAAASSRG